MQQQKFPNGRKRREIATDPITGQKYERYETEVQQTGNFPLFNETLNWKLEGEDEDEDEKFDDQFEEDILEKKRLRVFFMQQRNENFVEENVEERDELTLSRWDAYDSLGRMLERWEMFLRIYLNFENFYVT